MTFDMASFLLGILTLAAVCWLGYQIVRVAETRLREEAQWRTVLYDSSPSQDYWGKHLAEMPETFEDEASITIRPPSRPGRPL